jgi:hypothetical protein
MKEKNIFLVAVLMIVISIAWILSSSNKEESDFSERVKISLREAGNQLLLSEKDSTSLILPIVKKEDFKYRVSFQNHLLFSPTTLVSVVKNSLEAASFSKNYRVEVIECENKEVAYSYEINESEEKTIIPCAGRILPENCYLIDIKFIDKTKNDFFKKVFLITLTLLLVYLLKQLIPLKKKNNLTIESNENSIDIGVFLFYPHQNKLMQKTAEINLSKKECELLEIFVANKNKVVKREELTKKVWEDNGVFVGRSLDTYISKLRKKLKGDSSIKITNVHGIGYKLEIQK